MGFGFGLVGGRLQLGTHTDGSRAELALDSKYVHATSGDALGFRFLSPVTGELSKVYLFQYTAQTGASRRNLLVNTCAASTATQPGAVVADGATTVQWPDGAKKWMCATYSPGTRPAVTAGVVYWICVGNSNAENDEATNYPTVQRQASIPPIDTQYNLLQAYYSTDGFATAGTAQTAGPALIVLVFSDGTVIGCPYDDSATATTNALEKGLLLSSGVTEQLKIRDVRCGLLTGVSNHANIVIYSGSGATDRTVAQTTALDATAKTIGFGGMPEFTMLKGQAYRIVFTNSGGADTFTLKLLKIDDRASFTADLDAARLFGGGGQYTYWDGAAWVDDPASLPLMTLYVSGQVAIDETPTVGDVIPATTGRNYGSWHIDDYLTFAADYPMDADSLPTYRVYEDETAAPILTGTMAKLDDANTTGLYSERIQLTAASGFAKGYSYHIYIETEIESAVVTQVHFFQIEAAVDATVELTGTVSANVTQWKGATAPNLPANLADLSITETTGYVSPDPSLLASTTDIAEAAGTDAASKVALLSEDIGTSAAESFAASDVGANITNIKDTITFTSGTVQADAGNSTTSFLTNLTQTEDNHWKDSLVRITSGDLLGQQKRCMSYDGSTKVITTKPFSSTPAAGVTFELVNR